MFFMASENSVAPKAEKNSTAKVFQQVRFELHECRAVKCIPTILAIVMLTDAECRFSNPTADDFSWLNISFANEGLRRWWLWPAKYGP